MKDKLNEFGGYSEKKEMKIQPSESEFAGAMMGKTNDYTQRMDSMVSKEAGKIRMQAYKGKYD
jgi:hypothetical protein